ncbi:MAG: phenylalanine--tRNA ligase subunit beta [Planctomycetaceae bacterium]|nr:phenylalanine--tRNA ligase subunit beta [Planctomycetaceae bacterium]
MIVSWNWLKQYVPLEMPLDDLTDRLTMAGLNLEGVEQIEASGDAASASDVAIDLEVTSNRPDWLGHVGIAREVSVLYGVPLTVPQAAPPEGSTPAVEAVRVELECPELCPRYIARVIRNVKVGPSPAWLKDRLNAVGVASVNNVVDVTNYVLLETGQPLHAFDLDQLHGGRIVVREAVQGEKLVAIDQKTYELQAGMCVIADADRPVAVAGVMGGLETEIGESTVNVLIETADFAPLTVRNTARKLILHSPSSYRFERRVDASALDAVSRRCCELILEVAGGELQSGMVEAGAGSPPPQEAVTLRFSQLKRLLGIDIPREEAIRVLTSLGLEPVGEPGADEGAFVPPAWRRDLTREADLIEEVARIYGYDRIPDNVPVPLELSAKTLRDRVSGRVRDILTSCGFFEALTLSFVSQEQFELFQPLPGLEPLKVEHSSRRHENLLRQSLVPSLLHSLRGNERRGNAGAKLFEIARVYLRAEPGVAAAEPIRIGLVAGGPFAAMRGVIDALCQRLHISGKLELRPSEVPQFGEGRGAEVLLDGELWGWVGELDRDVADRIDLQEQVTVAELDLGLIEQRAVLVPPAELLPEYPPMDRDLNFVLEEDVTWQQLESVVVGAAGPLLESVGCGGQYRGKQIGPDRKSYVVTMRFRAPDRTLKSAEVDSAQQAVITAVEQNVAGTLR